MIEADPLPPKSRGEAMQEQRPARPKTYRRKLPRPDERGRIRVVVGQAKDGDGRMYPARFSVGNAADTAPADAMRRLDAVRTSTPGSAQDLGVDYWIGWVWFWAVRVAQAVPVVVYGKDEPCTGFGKGVPTTPSTGETMLVYERLSSACRSAAWSWASFASGRGKLGL